MCYEVMEGDCTNPADVACLMEGRHAKLLFTSPPYLDLYNYSGSNLSPTHLSSFIVAFKPYVDIMCVNLGLKKREHEIVQYWDEYIAAAKAAGLKLLAWNVWDKINPGSIAQQQYMFPLRHEFVFVFGEKPYALNRTIPKHGMDFKAGRKLSPYKKIRQPDGSMRNGTSNHRYHEVNKQLESVIQVGAVKGRPVYYPAQMPIALAEEYIKALTNEGDIVVDPFVGSGTTLIAAHRLNRSCLCMDISPDAIAATKARYQKECATIPLFTHP